MKCAVPFVTDKGRINFAAIARQRVSFNLLFPYYCTKTAHDGARVGCEWARAGARWMRALLEGTAGGEGGEAEAGEQVLMQSKAGCRAT